MTQGWPQISLWGLGPGPRGSCGAGAGVSLQGAVSTDPPRVAGGVSPQSLSEWRMQNIARDSENSSEEEFFDAHGTGTILEQAGWGQGCLRMGMHAQGCHPHPRFPPASAEDLSDSDEVFAKEMTKWSSNDFLDTLERPAELDETLGEHWGCSGPRSWGGCPGGG